jgi:hypothetical protein
VIIINKTSSTKYSGLADRDIGPSSRSADIDAAGLAAAMSKLVNGCGNAFCIRLNETERRLLDKIVELDVIGRATKVVAKPKAPNPLRELMRREAKADAARIASIKAAQGREASIRDEANYTSRKDMEDAKKRAGIIKGDVEAKKLDKSDKAPSLSDLMSDNKFIEESMKHSKIATAMASEDGWDMDKIREAKAQAAESVPAAEPAAEPVQEAEKPLQSDKAAKSKRTARAKKRVSNETPEPEQV